MGVNFLVRSQLLLSKFISWDLVEMIMHVVFIIVELPWNIRNQIYRKRNIALNVSSYLHSNCDKNFNAFTIFDIFAMFGRKVILFAKALRIYWSLGQGSNANKADSYPINLIKTKKSRDNFILRIFCGLNCSWLETTCGRLSHENHKH